MGRKPSKNPKSYTIRGRVDYKTIMELENCCEKLNLSKSELIRYLIDKASNELYYMDWEKGCTYIPITDPNLRKSRAERYLERLDKRNLLPKGISLKKSPGELTLAEKWKLAKARL